MHFDWFDFTHHKHTQYKQKGFAPILILVGILVIMIVAGGAYYFGKVSSKPVSISQVSATPTPKVDETVSPDRIGANWKTYTNNEMGLSFKYPAQRYLFTGPILSVLSQGEGNVQSVSVQFCPSQKLADCGFPADLLTISFFQNSKHWGLDQWIKSALNSPIYASGQEQCYVKDSRTNQSKQQYLNYPAFVVSFIIDEKTSKEACGGVPLEGGGKFKKVVIERSGQIVTLSISGASEENYKELDQILSTFKFTN